MTNINKYYQDGRYKINSKENFEKLAQEKVEIFIDLLKGQKFEKILDAGCGEGQLIKVIKDRFKAKVYGVDISKKGVKLTQEKGVKAKVADLSKKIPFPTSYFDLVISTEVLEHISDPDVFLREIYRVLKPKGKLLLTTPNLSSWFNRIIFSIGLYPLFLEASTELKVGYGRYKKYFYGDQLVGHIHVFNYLALRELIESQGFTIEKLVGKPVAFVSPRSKLFNITYTSIDRILSRFPSMGSDLLLVAKK